MSESKRIVLMYMDVELFDWNIERVANGKSVIWRSSPSVEAIIRWKNILRRHGVK